MATTGQVLLTAHTRWNHQRERGYDSWVLRDPWGQWVLCAAAGVPRATRTTSAVARCWHHSSWDLFW